MFAAMVVSVVVPLPDFNTYILSTRANMKDVRWIWLALLMLNLPVRSSLGR